MTATPTDAIPEDIDRIATDIVRAQCGTEDDPEWQMYLAIARAILAERERCAQIAMSRRSLPSLDADAYGTTLAIDIATAIRQPVSKANPNSARGFSSAEQAAEARLLPASVAANSTGEQ